ncbi:unnamed protein product [Urochloa humidicola]
MAKVEDYASGSSTFAGVRPREDRKAQNLMEPLAAAHIPLKIHILCFSHSGYDAEAAEPICNLHCVLANSHP